MQAVISKRRANDIDGIEKRKINCENSLSETEKQLEIAKNNANKPFAQEEELQKMQSRLNEINIELNLDELGMQVFDAEPDETDCEIKRKDKNMVRLKAQGKIFPCA